MACECLFAFALSLVTMHSVYSLGETDTHFPPTPPILSCMKCPPGFSTFCPLNGKSRCVRCLEGTFNEKPSRRSKCRSCSSCREDEFEMKPCTPTSDVVCKQCSKCAPGFVVLTPCGGTTDTVCEKCSVAKGYIECNEGEIEGHLIFNKSQEKENSKGSMTIIDEEKPWPYDKTKPNHQHEVDVDETYPKVIATSSEFLSINPTPSRSFSTKANAASPKRRLSSHSVITVSLSSSVDVSSKSTITVRASTDSSTIPNLLNHTIPPTIPAKLESPTKGKHTEPTTRTRFDITPKAEPSDHEMQGDDSNIPRHTTRRIIYRNSTRVTTSLKPRGLSSVSPSGRANIFEVNSRGMVDKHSTGLSPHYTLSATEVERAGEMPVPENTDASRSKSSHRWLWGVAALAIGVTVLAVIGIRWRQCRESKGCFFKCGQPKCKLPRCPGPRDCCDGTSVSSVAGVYAEQNHGNTLSFGVPPTVTIEHESEDSRANSSSQTTHTYLPQTVLAEVHHSTPSVFEVFDIRSYITQAEDTFNSLGGRLTAPDSDVIINIDSGAVPEGVNQPFFFRVVYDETSLLRDIPETPDRTLISPVIQCGPENITLMKPVEIIVPHCLSMDEVKKDSVSVYRCENGQLKWERVPSASEKNGQSKSWFTVKKDSIHIKTKTFSFWSIFACGGPKRKRATVFASQPNSEFDTICFRFYIYSDSEDSKKRVRTKERDLFPGSKQANEVPFKMYNDSRDITVTLDELENGWEMDKTPSTQTFSYDTAYRNGFRSHTSCEFAVKPQATSQAVSVFSCNLKFQQDEHTEHTIYLNPGFTPRQFQNIRRSSEESRGSETPSNSTGAGNEDEASDSQDESSPGSPAKVSDSPNHCLQILGCDHKRVTENHCHCICAEMGANWRKVLRNLGTQQVAIDNLEENFTKVEEKCFQGLLKWSRSTLTQKATTKSLCDALRQEGCFKALETLEKEGVSCDACAQIPESNPDLGTRV